METTGAYPLPRERNLILAALLVLAAAAWGVLIWQSVSMGSDTMGDAGMGDTATGLTMGMSALLFLAIWVAMMVAMMFPTAAPMILMFDRIAAGKRGRGQAFVPTWIFVAAYLVIWTLFGVLAYLLALGAERLADRSMWLMDHAARIGGVALIVAGLYQLSPLKAVCLTKCRSPFQYVLNSWRDGYGGAFRMGLEHGVYCLGCCWLLFVILFPLGMMNVAVLALITALIFAEKALPVGRRISQVAAVALVAYGVLVLVMPDALPTMM
jgi:predicted metal-binding membrane protein